MSQVAREEGVRRDDRVPWTYGLLAALLVGYVALCTGNRVNMWGVDAWEHHRALKALVEDPSRPENPTYASAHPSARYSPYLLIWALFGRSTGIDAFEVLGIAATVNTALLFLGVAVLLKSFGEGRSATATIPVMLGLYGGVPGHSNSYALADLPWQQVNPSAFAFPTALIVLALFKRFERRGWKDIAFPLMVILAAVSLLDHVISGVFGLFGMGVFALTAPRSERRRLLTALVLVGAGAALLCLAWPWYGFLQAATIKLPRFFVNPMIIWIVITRWCVPALVLSVFALTIPHSPAIRVLLLAGYASYVVGLIAYLLPEWSPGAGAFSRMGMPGLIYFHLALGIFAHHRGLFQPSTWPGRLRALVREPGPDAAMPAIEIVLTATVLYFLAPQFWSILAEPHLARPYLARVLGRESKVLAIKPMFDRLLEPIGLKDVVISDESTMWVVPSSRGRVIFSSHGELFVPGQEDRRRDMTTFFDRETSDSDRIKLIERYNVKWIVLNPKFLDASDLDSLLVNEAVARREHGLILMDARTWVRMRQEGDRADRPAWNPPANGRDALAPTSVKPDR